MPCRPPGCSFNQTPPSTPQGAYEARSVFQSLDLAWSLLRLFPRELLRRVTGKTLDKVRRPPAQPARTRTAAAATLRR